MSEIDRKEKLLKELKDLEQQLNVRQSTSLKNLNRNKRSLFLFIGFCVIGMFLSVIFDFKTRLLCEIYFVGSLVGIVNTLRGINIIERELVRDKELMSQVDALGNYPEMFFQKNWKKRYSIMKKNSKLLDGFYSEQFGYSMMCGLLIYFAIVLLTMIVHR
jgi:hypothetical protein